MSVLIRWWFTLFRSYQQILVDFFRCSLDHNLSYFCARGVLFVKCKCITNILRISVVKKTSSSGDERNWFRKCLMTSYDMTHDFHIRDSEKILFLAPAVLKFLMNKLFSRSYVRNINISFTTVLIWAANRRHKKKSSRWSRTRKRSWKCFLESEEVFKLSTLADWGANDRAIYANNETRVLNQKHSVNIFFSSGDDIEKRADDVNVTIFFLFYVPISARVNQNLNLIISLRTRT